MSAKTVASAKFKAQCLRIIDQVSKDRQPVTITKRGRPVAVLGPVPTCNEQPAIFGVMRGSVLRYDAPFEPATDPNDWAAMNDGS